MVADLLAFAQCAVEAQKHLLRSLLGLGGIKAESQQVAVHVFARLLEQLRHLVADLRGGTVFPNHTHKFFTQRIGWHSCPYARNPKTPEDCAQLHPERKNVIFWPPVDGP